MLVAYDPKWRGRSEVRDPSFVKGGMDAVIGWGVEPAIGGRLD